MRIRLTAVLFVSLMALTALPLGAQDATPTAIVPDPSLCTLNPLTPDDLRRISESGKAPRPTSTPITENIVLPGGKELFTSEREEIEKDIRRAIACVNTGEPLKALAAYTDTWIGSFLTAQGGLDDDLIAGLQVDRNLQPDDYLRIASFGDGARLPDDRVAIVVVGVDPTESPDPKPRLFVMAEVAPGRYLIDEVVPIDV